MREKILRTGMLVFLLILQIGMGVALSRDKPVWQVLPPAPSHHAADAQAFGDAQFLYRVLVMDLQNFGDTGGRLTPLKDYDMSRVVDWLRALDRLDYSANHHVTLGARYFAQTQDRSQLHQLLAYLRAHVDGDPTQKLQWLMEALHIARVRLKDENLVLEIADQLGRYDTPTMSVTAYQLPATIYERAGDFAQAAKYMARARGLLRGRVAPAVDQAMADYVDRMTARASENTSGGLGR